ncbi:coenzyme PQQ synthesis protein C [Klebsiella pneumoniae]|nr:coenzyme PQQ synthesis protein C [Klebsiella pneumoniae]
MLITDTLSPQAFEEALRAKGAFYHIHHPYHIAMHNGDATREQIQGWVANRFYYQTTIPLKDAAIMANCPDAQTRRKWVQRILDHDGSHGEDGGIEAWLRLGEAVGLSRDDLLSERHVLPGVRFAVDAYLNFARRACWQEAACSSLTELFAPQIHQSRLDSWPQHYPWIKEEGYFYFRSRLSQANRDVEHGLALAKAYCDSAEKQNRMLEILQFKLDILWSMLDAMTMAYALQRPPYHTVTGQGGLAHDPTGVIMQKTSIVAFRRGYRLQWEAAQESHVILYPEGMAKLNETAAAILELVDGRRDVAAIIAMLNERFPEAGGVDDDVIEFLQIACQQKWITCREPE